MLAVSPSEVAREKELAISGGMTVEEAAEIPYENWAAACPKAVPQPAELVQRLDEWAARARHKADSIKGALWTQESENTFGRIKQWAQDGAFSGSFQTPVSFSWYLA